MSDVLATMFDSQGRATPYLLQRWRAKGALRPLQPLAQYVAERHATTAFRGLWDIAFPSRSALPLGPITTKAGTFTAEMLDIWL